MDGQAGDAVDVLDPEPAVVAARLDVVALLQAAAQVVPGGRQRGGEAEGVLAAGAGAGAAAAGDLPDPDAAVLVRGEHAGAGGRERLHRAGAAVAEPGELAEIGLLPQDDVVAEGGAEDELAAEGDAGDGAGVPREHR